jgi:hypothetical protein
MVALAAGSSRRRTEISSQTKITTVMLGSELINFSVARYDIDSYWGRIDEQKSVLAK